MKNELYLRQEISKDAARSSYFFSPTLPAAAISLLIIALAPQAMAQYLPPTASDSSLTVSENTANNAGTFSVSDPSCAITGYINSGPAHGSVTITGTKTFTYTPSTCYYGSDSFTFYFKQTVCGGQSATKTVSITINKVNYPPTITSIATVNDLPWYAPSTIPLTGIAAGNCGSTVALTASSSNTTLLPNPTVIYTSPNAMGTLNLNPNVQAFTSAENTITITTTVSDGVNNPVNMSFNVNIPMGFLFRRGW